MNRAWLGEIATGDKQAWPATQCAQLWMEWRLIKTHPLGFVVSATRRKKYCLK